MNNFVLCGIGALLISGLISESTQGQRRESSNACSSERQGCDFSKFRRLREPHTLLKSVVEKVEPEYPSGARSVKADGRVIVRVLVSRSGDVAKACVIEGHPLLRAASLKAAKQWKFKKNFGFSDYKPNEPFAEIDLIFDFVLP